MKLVLFVVIQVIVPLLIGNLWNIRESKSAMINLIEMYFAGYLSMTALFQVICVPACFLQIRFSVLSVVFILIIIALSIYSEIKIYYVIKEYGFPKKIHWNNWAVSEYIYLALIIGFLLWQLYYAIFYDMTYISLDDATYLAYANAAISDDRMYLTNTITGTAIGLDIKRYLQSSIIFISYLAKFTGYNVTTMAHTVMPVQLIIMSYAATILIARNLFNKRENRLILLLFAEVLYMYGLYSVYSMTYRLLGPIWQGKAILQVVLTPYLFSLIPRLYKKNYVLKMGIYLMIISISASACTLGGTLAMAVIIGVLDVLFLFVKKDLRKLLYIVWGCIFPLIYALTYLIIR